MKTILLALLFISAFSPGQNTFRREDRHQPVQGEIWTIEYSLADGFQTGISALHSLSSKEEKDSARKSLQKLCAAKVFEYWLTITYDPVLTARPKIENRGVISLENKMKQVFNNLKLTDEEKKYPLGYRDQILNLDGSRALSESVSSLFTPYFPQKEITRVSDYESLILKFSGAAGMSGE